MNQPVAMKHRAYKSTVTRDLNSDEAIDGRNRERPCNICMGGTRHVTGDSRRGRKLAEDRYLLVEIKKCGISEGKQGGEPAGNDIAYANSCASHSRSNIRLLKRTTTGTDPIVHPL
jgi:hypothetical protein